MRRNRKSNTHSLMLAIGKIASVLSSELERGIRYYSNTRAKTFSPPILATRIRIQPWRRHRRDGFVG